MEAVGTIVKVVQEIVKAAETARQNRKRCLDLGDRARTVGDILREDRGSTTSRIAGGVSRAALERLKAALDDALELVESQRRSGGLGIPKLITSGRTAARFQDVETRITACIVDLGLAEQIAAGRRDHRAKEEAAPVHEPPPPQQQHQGKDGPSLPQGYQAQAQSAPPPVSFYDQYLQQAQQSLLQAYLPQSAPPPPPAQQGNDVLQAYLSQSAQRGKDAQDFLQDYHAQSAQRGKEAQAFLQEYHAQSAQRGKEAQAFLQVYHAQREQLGKEAQASLQEYHAQSAQRGKDAQAMLQGYLAQSASSQQQGQDVQSLLKGYGYFAM
ncbi:uncharacterized protein [Lolium perenne]|uniref:uncharacterized protein n=1 Tax=Lolium perenne TaxID=4522 RepID=UPI0021EAF543|nr:uncharacterized protein LOC127313680 [Lolium perenne]